MPKRDILKDKTVYCPRWSSILGTKTPCLEGNCTNFIPSQEIEGEFFEGFCREMGIFDCLSAIMVSLGVISGQMALQSTEDTQEEQEKEEVGVQYG